MYLLAQHSDINKVVNAFTTLMIYQNVYKYLMAQHSDINKLVNAFTMKMDMHVFKMEKDPIL